MNQIKFNSVGNRCMPTRDGKRIVALVNAATELLLVTYQPFDAHLKILFRPNDHLLNVVLR